jgi:hypothetical protein
MSASKTKRPARHAVREHLPKWMLESAAEANEILAASPYVTDARLFSGCDAKCARLYTDFSTLNFIAGASSLRILKKLLNDGVAIYHVAFLHAKAVMVDGEHFSLGSQNLTVRGRRKNVEANFVAGSDTPSNEVRKFFDRLHQDARPVSMSDILEMEKRIGPLIREFKEIERTSAGVDHDVELARLAREEEERVKRAEEERAKQETAERSALMKRALSRNKHFFDRSKTNAGNHLLASVRKLTRTLNPFEIYSIGDGTTDSLVPVDRKRSFEGLLRAIGKWPQRLSRYLLINEEDGKLGFVRYAKTRWTFFGSGVAPEEQIKVCGNTWSVRIVFDWTHEATMQRNGVIILQITNRPNHKKGTTVSTGFAFSVNGVEMEESIISGGEKPSILEIMWRKRDVKATEALLKDYLERHLTEPFMFKEKLTGLQAFNFFGHRHPVTYRIQAHLFGDTAIFSSRRCS